MKDFTNLRLLTLLCFISLGISYAWGEDIATALANANIVAVGEANNGYAQIIAMSPSLYWTPQIVGESECNEGLVNDTKNDSWDNLW